jgi:hypothetical protein
LQPLVPRAGETLRRPSLLRRLAPWLAFGIVIVIGKGGQAEPGDPTRTPLAEAVAKVSASTDEPTAVTPEVTATASQPADKKKAKSAWRGSEIALRHSATTLSFDRAADLTYNPTVVMSFELAPRFSFDDVWSVGATFGFNYEYTQADSNTRANETTLDDTTLSLSASRFAKIPGAGIDISAGLGFTFPTSLSSQGDTLMLAVAPSLRLAKTFESVLSGLSLGYSLRFTKYFHEYTTGATDTPQIPGCSAGSAIACESLLSTGYRNPSFRVANTFDADLAFTDWLSLSASFGLYTTWLYDDVDDSRVSHTELEPADQRFAMMGDVGVSARFWKPLEMRLGLFTINPQLASNGDRYAPFVNRFSTLYLDLRLDVAALIQTLTEEN